MPRQPSAAVVVLHGGGSRRDRMRVSPTQLSVLRMIPIARSLARKHPHAGVFRLLNSARGWDTHLTPLADAEWAVAKVVERLGPVPVALVGHSLGGRAALLAAGSPHVGPVVALNPYLLPGDDRNIAGGPLLVVHGSDDRIASPAIAAKTVRRLQERGIDASFTEVPGGRHAMLRHHGEFQRPASDFVTMALNGDGDAGSSARRRR